MRNSLLTVLLFLILCSGLQAQYCGFSGITLASQSDVDNFPANYPGCTIVEGNLDIVGNGITNLNGLSALTSINKNLLIMGTTGLTSLAGLGSLESVSGVFSLSNNSGLTNLAGLTKLEYIHALGLGDNANFVNLQGLNALNASSIHEINLSNNPLLSSLSGIEKLEGLQRLILTDNASLSDLSALSGITIIAGTLSIGGQNSLTSLNGLQKLQRIDGAFQLIDYKGSSLAGLSALTYVGSDFYFWNNSLTDFAGLEKLAHVGGELWIGNHPNLQSLSALSALSSVGSKVDVRQNAQLTSLTGLDNINTSTLSSVMILDCPLLSDCSVKSICSYLRDPSNFAAISNNAAGCASVQEVRQSGICIALPVDLVEFEGYWTAEGNKLTWKTAEELVNKGFEIERSADARMFTKIGFVEGHGNTSSEQKYSFTDNAPSPTTYYRLKQLDYDGKWTHSKIIVVKEGSPTAKVYPNPARGQLHIESVNGNQPYNIRNSQGFSVMESSMLPSKPLDTSSLRNGLYLITVGKEVFKVAVQN